MNRKNRRSLTSLERAALTICGVAFLAGTAYADLRLLRGYSYVYPNDPPYADGYYAKVKRFPIGDSVAVPLTPTEGRYLLDLSDLSGRAIQLGDTLELHSYYVNDSVQCASLIIPVDSSMFIQGDTLPFEYHPHSMVLRNPALSTNVFCIDAKGVVDTSQALDSLKVAFWTTGSDTAYVSYPPYPTIASYDSLRLNTQLLNTNVGDSQPVSMRIYKGEFSDTMSMFTDTTVYIQRQIGRFTNDAMRVPNMVYPKTVIGVHEGVPPQRPRHSRLRSPCRAADLARYFRDNGGRVEVRDISGRRRWPGDPASFPSGVYVLRFSDDFHLTGKVVLK